MNAPRACVLGCHTPDGTPFRASPGRRTCDPCAAKLWKVLEQIGSTYATLTDIDELVPGGSGEGGPRAVPGSRSPTVDAHLAMADPRTEGADIPGALAAVAEWARFVRAELSIDTPPEQMRGTLPTGRLTMERELQTIRFHWHWILGQTWVVDFAKRMRALLASMRTVGRLNPPELQIGTCPTLVWALPMPDGSTMEFACAARLKVRVGDSEIQCRNCRTVWPKEKWGQLGSPWTDYPRLSEELDVPVGTLRRWCAEERWAVDGTRGRRLVSRADALGSRALAALTARRGLREAG
jgi:hypothetical protein